LFLYKVAIPPNGVVATPIHGETDADMAWGKTKPMVGSNLAVLGRSAENKGPLSALEVRKTIPTESSTEEPSNGPPCETLQEVASIRAHRGWVKNLAFASDRGFVVSAGPEGGIRLHRFRHEGSTDQTFPHMHSGGVQSLALAPDNLKLASAATQPEEVVRLWDLTNIRPRLLALLQVPKVNIEALVFSPRSNWLAASCDKSILIWNVAGPVQRPDFLSTDLGETEKWLVFSPDGLTMASAGASGPIQLWSLDNSGLKRQAALKDSNTRWESLAFSPSGQWLAGGGQDCIIHLWQFQPGARPQLFSLKGHGAPVRLVSFPSNGQTLMSVDQKNWVYLWDISTGKRTRQWQLPGGTTVAGIAGTCDGRYLAAGTMGIVKVYRLYPKNQESAKTVIK
jgi:WD40 repeat protein